MLKLIKYEFRKQLFTKFIMLFLAGLLECFFLFSYIADDQNKIAASTIIYMVLAMGSILFVSFECINTYSNDLKTKCSYMLFMTPHSSYCIIGAKALSTVLQILLTSAAYIVLGLIDFTMIVAKYDDLSNLLDHLSQIFNINMTVDKFLIMVSSVIASWICIVLVAFLAITLSQTFLANKRGKGFVSFLIFLVVNFAEWKIIDYAVLKLALQNSVGENLLSIGINIVFAALSYVVTSYMLEKKVSL